MASEDSDTLWTARMNPTPTRVLIIDGHLAVGQGLKALVQAMPGLQVVGLCTRGERGLAQAAQSTPDVALVDADLPGLCGAAVIRLLRWRFPRTRVVALGTYAERESMAFGAGAHAFVLKDAGYDALYSAITDDTAGSGHSDALEIVNWMTAQPVQRPIAHGERMLS
jgi:DNA-binding NarL/FixJ family response regulator